MSRIADQPSRIFVGKFSQFLEGAPHRFDVGTPAIRLTAVSSNFGG
jgi:hypothetical protein